jgi:hypothetical protein
MLFGVCVAKLRGIWCARHVFVVVLEYKQVGLLRMQLHHPLLGLGIAPSLPSFEPFKTMAHTLARPTIHYPKREKHTHTHTHMSKWCSNFVTLWLMVREETKKSITSRDQVQPICHMQSWLEHVMKHYWTWGSCFALPSMVPSYSQGSNLEARMNQIWPTHHHPLQSLL